MNVSVYIEEKELMERSGCHDVTSLCIEGVGLPSPAQSKDLIKLQAFCQIECRDRQPLLKLPAFLIQIGTGKDFCASSSSF